MHAVIGSLIAFSNAGGLGVMTAGHEARGAVVLAKRVDHDDEPEQRPRVLVGPHVDMQRLCRGAGLHGPPAERAQFELRAYGIGTGEEHELEHVQLVELGVAGDEIG